ncbi:MAG: hypothetical protein CM15mP66_03630 [Pseudomonadota bacterium]|nr:MAG: hypothetical protein CM15mP66_03630 [Pseudomonadota bacterium]
MPDQNVIGAIDIGSNAIRMICARLTEDYRIEELEKNRTPIRLGEDVFRMGYITEERIEQLLATIKVYQKTLEQNNCKEICAYCTSAFRESGNRQTVIERVEMETGIQLESISGGKEAQLLQRVVQRVMDLSKGRVMLADLGGGSLEVTLLEDGEIEFAESFRMGTVRMLKMFPYHPEREKAFLNWAEYYVEDFIDFLKKRLGKPRVETLVITGGNATAIGRFSGKTDRDAPGFSQGRMILDKQRFSKFKRSVIKLNLNERIRDLEMEEDRADVILPALVIFEKLLKFTGCSGFVIPRSDSVTGSWMRCGNGREPTGLEHPGAGHPFCPLLCRKVHWPTCSTRKPCGNSRFSSSMNCLSSMNSSPGTGCCWKWRLCYTILAVSSAFGSCQTFDVPDPEHGTGRRHQQ